MKAINIKKNKMSASMNKNQNRAIDLTDRQPCWYAVLEEKSDRSKSKWVVGMKEYGSKDEYSFKISKTGDVTDEKFWAYISSEDFAIELLGLFRNGGEIAVANWVRNGCLE